jgi:hypothetical protein
LFDEGSGKRKLNVPNAPDSNARACGEVALFPPFSCKKSVKSPRDSQPFDLDVESTDYYSESALAVENAVGEGLPYPRDSRAV